ncbi:thymidylate kinase, partial [Leptonychotes weddellii]|uniref:Thymidylate kinase n=1 Tax=Leptonychotes weddellii TaxID=9713 RepID=A0A7F8QBD3_LEPWE
CAAGHRAELLRFPERSTEIGKLLSSYLEKKSEVEDHSVHLLFSANRWEQVQALTVLFSSCLPPWGQMVDASKSIEDVHKEIHALCVYTIQAAAQRPLGELWK